MAETLPIIAEHLLYSGALAVVVGIVFHRLVPGDAKPYACIVVLSAFSPDLVTRLMSDLSRAGISLSSI